MTEVESKQVGCLIFEIWRTVLANFSHQKRVKKVRKVLMYYRFIFIFKQDYSHNVLCVVRSVASVDKGKSDEEQHVHLPPQVNLSLVDKTVFFFSNRLNNLAIFRFD